MISATFLRRALSVAAVCMMILVVPGCGSDDGAPVMTQEPEDFVAEASDFECLQDWERIRNIRITNALGHLDEALELARNPVPGAQYPVGTMVQLVPFEAMVKRGPDFDPENNNWEYFELGVSANGTEIRTRGRDEVINQFGGQCFPCHEAARDFDFICEKDHGCIKLPLTDDLITRVQNNDPRCPK